MCTVVLKCVYTFGLYYLRLLFALCDKKRMPGMDEVERAGVIMMCGRPVLSTAFSKRVWVAQNVYFVNGE